MNYLRWHYIQTPKFILEITGNYLFFFGHLFSVKLLIRNLFSPWRREEAKKSKPGLNLEDIVNVITFNIVSRILGFFIRICAIIAALLFEIFTLVLGIFIFVVWLFIPIISLPVFFLTQRKDNPQEKNNFIEKHLEKDAGKEDIDKISQWYEKIKNEKGKSQKFWTRENLASVPPVGSGWIFGYTPLIDTLTRDLSKDDLNLDRFVGRQDELELIETTLTKEKNHNPLLVGEPGTGKLTILITLAKLIESGRALPNLLYKKLLLLDMDRILSQNIVKTQENIAGVLEEAKQAGNIILVIPALEEFIKNPQISISRVLIEHLEEENLQIVGITNPFSYQKYFRPNPAILKVFEKIEINEIGKDEAMEVLENNAVRLEEENNLTITYEALSEILERAQDLISDIPLPQSSLNLLEETFVKAKTDGLKQITVADVDKILSVKTKIPVGQLTQKEKVKLEDLENTLHKRIIGQDLAITKICDALKRKGAGVESKNKPIGTFLFVGPTGVGKTETAKALAQSYFGNEEQLIRLDMSEFQNESDIQKLIGDSDNPGILTSKVRENPFTVLLLDEFEKANSKILNLFLTVFDEGYITDGQGKKVSFKNTVIIATSNAGSEFIREKVMQKTAVSDLEKELLDYLLREKLFSPELLNRFDAVVFYRPLSEDEIEKVTGLMIEKLNTKLMNDKGITLKISPETIKKIAEMGYDPVFGARGLQRVIDENIENKVAEKILSENPQKGAQIEINL